MRSFAAHIPFFFIGNYSVTNFQGIFKKKRDKSGSFWGKKILGEGWCRSKERICLARFRGYGDYAPFTVASKAAQARAALAASKMTVWYRIGRICCLYKMRAI